MCAACRCYVTSSYLLCDVIFCFERAAAFQFQHEHETTGLRTNLHLFVKVDVYHDLDHLNHLVTGEDGWSHSSCLVLMTMTMFIWI